MKRIRRYLLVKSVGVYLNLFSYLHPEKAMLRAYRYFSEPRLGKLKKDQLPEILQKATVETCSHDGHDIQFYLWPEAQMEPDDTKKPTQTVLLLHGWESNASRWEQLVPYLQRQGFSVIAIDAPAHGLSGGTEFTVPHYAEFIDVAVKRFKPDAIVAHSMGGVASIYHQYLSAEQLRKMVLLGAPSDLQLLLDNFTKLLGLNQRITKKLDQYFMDRFSIKTREFSGGHFGRKLRLKGIIAHDTDDTVVAFSESQKIAGSWKHAQFIETKGLGHSMHDADLYLRVSQFLAED